MSTVMASTSLDATRRQKQTIALYRARIWDKPERVNGKSVWPQFQAWMWGLTGKSHISELSHDEAVVVIDCLSRVAPGRRAA